MPVDSAPFWHGTGTRYLSDGFCQVWPQAIPKGREALLTGSGRQQRFPVAVQGAFFSLNRAGAIFKVGPGPPVRVHRSDGASA
jgi:hypothetical protein